MGVLDKLKFWKNEDSFLSEPPAYDLGARDALKTQETPTQPEGQPDAFSHDVFGAERPSGPSQPYPQQAYPQSTPFPGSVQSVQHAPEQFPESVHPRDVELILAKLDAIKSEMDALHQRIRKIEQTMDTQAAQKRYW